MHSQLWIFEGKNMSHCLKLLWKQNQLPAGKRWTILASLPMYYGVWFATHRDIFWPGHWIVPAVSTFKDTAVKAVKLHLLYHVFYSTRGLDLPISPFILPTILSLLIRCRHTAFYLRINSGFTPWHIINYTYNDDLAMKTTNWALQLAKSTKLMWRDAKKRIFYCLRQTSSFQSSRKSNVWSIFFYLIRFRKLICLFCAHYQKTTGSKE